MKKESLMQWGRYTLGAAAIAWIMLDVMRSGQLGYSLIEVLLLFSILFVGYKYGPGTGAVIGTACGIILTIWQRDMGELGILAVMGVMAGLFRQLGRFASVISFAVGAAGVGLLYAPELFKESIPSLLICMLIFCILPKTLIKPDGIKTEPKVLIPDMDDVDGLMGRRFNQIADSFSELAKSFTENQGPTPAIQMAEGMDYQWRNRYLESRAVVAEQYMQLSHLMRGFREEMKNTVDITADAEMAMRNQLKAHHIHTEKMIMVEGENKRREAVLTLWTDNGSSVTAKEIAQILGSVGDCRWKPAVDSRPVVTGQVSIVRLEEDTNFMMLHGIARAVKEEEEVSGDNFSFTRLPKGKMFMSLCDGMGSGGRAYRESKRAIELTEQLMEAGFQPNTVLKMVHNALMMQEEELHPLTMDMAVIDLYSGICDFIKSGAAVTLIKQETHVDILRSEALPMGFLPQIEPMESLYKLRDGDFIIMVTDGIVEAFSGEDKEEEFRNFCSRLKGTNPRDMANKILIYAMAGDDGGVRDDMTVLVAGVWKK